MANFCIQAIYPQGLSHAHDIHIPGPGGTQSFLAVWVAGLTTAYF